MSKARTPTDSHEAVNPTLLYPLSTLQRITGMGEAALRSARRAGLQVRYAGGRCYVYGQHYIDYVLSQPGEKTGASDTATDQ